ncbi:MAG: ABC transporter substrate-binding protein [Reyranellaceae bacterium]
MIQVKLTSCFDVLAWRAVVAERDARAVRTDADERGYRKVLTRHPGGGPRLRALADHCRGSRLEKTVEIWRWIGPLLGPNWGTVLRNGAYTPTCSAASAIYMMLVVPKPATARRERSVSSFVRRRSVLHLATGAAVIALAVPGVAVVAPGRAGAEQDPAAQLVQRAADQVIAAARAGAGAAREAGIRGALEAYFDLAYMGRQTLGNYWNQTTPEQRQRFLKANASAEARAYAERFGQYRGQTLTVGRVNARGNGVSIVDSTLNQSDGAPVALQWEVRNEGQGPRIVDVKSEGVSMIMTRRGDFVSYIRNHGGQVEPLISELEARATR